MDEDLTHTIGGVADGDGTTATYYNFYRTGAAAWAWEKLAMPYRWTSAGYIQYDASGTMTEGQANRWYNSYLLFTNLSGEAGFMIIPGRGEFSSLAAAQAESIGTFSFAGLGIAEFVVAYQFTWSTNNSYSTKGKCRLAATPKHVDVSVVTTAVAAISADHNSLSGIQGGSSTERYHLLQTQHDGQWDALGAGAAVEAGSKLKVAGHAYIVQYAVGAGGAAKTIDWSNGNEQTITLDSDCTLTFTNGKAGGRYVLVFTQDGTGGWAIAWPGTVVWSGGIEPTLDTDPAGISLIAFYYDGSNYIGAGANAAAAANGMPEVPLAVIHGGTGKMAITNGQILVGNGAGGFTAVAAPAATGQVLSGNLGIDGKVEWASVRSLTPPATCLVYMASDDVVNMSEEVSIVFDAEVFDDFDMHDSGTHPERVTIPDGHAGIYVVTAGLGWGASGAAVGLLATRIYLNGTMVFQTANGLSYDLEGNGTVTYQMKLEEGDYLELRCYSRTTFTVDLKAGPYKTYLFLTQVI